MCVRLGARRLRRRNAQQGKHSDGKLLFHKEKTMLLLSLRQEKSQRPS